MGTTGDATRAEIMGSHKQETASARARAGGDRAVSLGEVVVDEGWELQLKGGGRTPFCRGRMGGRFEIFSQEFLAGGRALLEGSY